MDGDLIKKNISFVFDLVSFVFKHIFYFVLLLLPCYFESAFFCKYFLCLVILVILMLFLFTAISSASFCFEFMESVIFEVYICGFGYGCVCEIN